VSNWVFDVNREWNFIELIGQVACETTRAVGGANLGTEDEGCTCWHGVGVVGIGHRVCCLILTKSHTWRASYRCLAAKLSEGYPKEIDFRQGLAEI